MSLRKLGSETLIYGLSNVLGKLLNFALVVPFLTRIMAEDFGVVGDLFFWTAFLIALLTFRLDTAVFRFASRPENDAAMVFRRAQLFVFGFSALVLGSCALFGRQLAVALDYPGRTDYVYLVLLTIGFDALSAVPLARLRLQQRPWRFVAANLGNVLVNLLLIYLLLVVWPRQGQLFGYAYDPARRVTWYLITIAGAAAFRYLFLLLEGGWSPVAAPSQPATSAPPLRAMLRYSLPLTIVAVAGIVNGLIGPTIIRRVLTDQAASGDLLAGQFNAALKLAVFLNLAVTAYNYAAEPFFFRQAGGDPARADKQIYADALRAYGIIASLACAGILLFLPWLQFFIRDEALRAGLYVLPVLLAANVCLGLYINLSVAYKLTDKTFLGGGIALLGSLAVLLVNVLCIDTLGLLAPALGMLAGYVLMSLLAYGVSRRYFPVAYPLARLGGYALLTLGAVAAGEYLAASGVFASNVGGESQSVAILTPAGMLVRGGLFLLLVVSLGVMERSWLRRTFRR